MSKRGDALTVRRARLDEHEALEALQRRASLALPDYREQLLANPDAIDLPIEQIALGQVLVAESGGQIAGFAAVIVDEHAAELDGLFVAPEQWGTGIGRRLASEATHLARGRGFALQVVAAPNVRAFYERCGFTLEGQAETRFGPALRMTR